MSLERRQQPATQPACYAGGPEGSEGSTPSRSVGPVPEWLGSRLQSGVRRFDSALGLSDMDDRVVVWCGRIAAACFAVALFATAMGVLQATGMIG